MTTMCARPCTMLCSLVLAAAGAACGGANLVSAEASTVTAMPQTLPADGKALSTITVTLRSYGGEPVPGRRVMLRTAWSSTSGFRAGATDDAGRTWGEVGCGQTGNQAVEALVESGGQWLPLKQTVLTCIAP